MCEPCYNFQPTTAKVLRQTVLLPGSLLENGHSQLGVGTLHLQEILASVCQHFWLSELQRGCSRHLVGREQGCDGTKCPALYGTGPLPPQQKPVQSTLLR